ncbi:hypothetical protein DER45DRAFT_571435 [Fusarium avenaceum]|nr:hypothetical protein DER45DRAFT_571435 [Fusarium avenaceum]
MQAPYLPTAASLEAWLVILVTLNRQLPSATLQQKQSLVSPAASFCSPSRRGGYKNLYSNVSAKADRDFLT